jgi:hypothetical protein
LIGLFQRPQLFLSTDLLSNRILLVAAKGTQKRLPVATVALPVLFATSQTSCCPPFPSRLALLLLVNSKSFVFVRPHMIISIACISHIFILAAFRKRRRKTLCLEKDEGIFGRRMIMIRGKI